MKRFVEGEDRNGPVITGLTAAAKCRSSPKTYFASG
jgi:hypothetical protein